MGNQLAVQQPRNQTESVAELPNVVYKDTLGGGRFFKSSLCVHDDGGLVVVKVYQKRADSPDVRPYEERLAEIRSRLLGVNYPHVWPTQKFFHSERAVYLMRQYLFANLSRRITSRPFFSLVEKKWVAYQLLLGVVQCHERSVCHGDIKSENVLLTSWNWAFLVDFAPYKPVMLPADNPADFSFFFDTSGRRKCYLAPERFYDSASARPDQETAAAKLSPAMDVFAAGCVLAELFMDGQPLFDYSKLLAYRQGNYDPAPALGKLDAGVQQVVLTMIQRDPAKRRPAAECLQMLVQLALPAEFESLVRPFFSSMLHLDSDARAVLVSEEYVHLRQKLVGEGHGKADGSAKATRASDEGAALALPLVETDQQQRRSRQSLQGEVSSLLAQTQTVLQKLESSGARQHRRSSSGSRGSRGQEASSAQQQAGMPLGEACGESAQQAQQTSVEPGEQPADSTVPAAALPAAAAAAEAVAVSSSAVPGVAGGECMVLLAVLLCTLLRGARLQEHKTRMVELLRDASQFCDDDSRLQRVVPYLIAATSEPLAAVKCRALRALAAVLAQVRSVPPSDAKIFTEYILPCLSLLPTEAELSVQVEYASVISQLADTAQAFLEQQQRRQLHYARKMVAEGSNTAGGGARMSLMDYDEEMSHLRACVERAVHDLLVGPHAETKLAILPHLRRLASFCGRRDTADLLLPPLLTFPNSPHWQVRAAFYRHLCGVGPSLGGEGLVAIIYPFLDRMLTGPEEAVAAEAVYFLARVCSQGLLRRRFLLMVASRLVQLRLLQSHSTAVRAAAVQYITWAASQLSPAEVYALLMPLVRPLLSQEPLSLEAPALVVRALPNSFSPSHTPSSSSSREQQTQQAPPPGLPRRYSVDPGSGMPNQQPAGGSLHSSASPGPGSAAALLGAPLPTPPPVPGARSLVIPAPASAASYSISLHTRYLHPGASFLSAALEQSLVGSAAHGGHLIASASAAGAAPGQGRVGGSRLHYSAHMSAAERGMHLVARAKRSLQHHPGVGEAMLQRQLSPGAMYGTAMYGIDESSPQPAAPAPPPSVRDAMAAAVSAGLPDASDLAAAAAAWHPRGVLVAHLAEHKKAVNCLAVSQSGTFFVSGSSDEAVKVWDCRRLEKDISFRSRLTYTGQGGRISCVAACHDGQSVASGSSNGSIHVWRVEYTCRTAAGAGSGGSTAERYTGITHLRQVSPDSGAVLEVASWGPSLLIYTTQRGGLAAWDLRMSSDAWALTSDPSQGLLEHVALDPCAHNWLVSGSSRGQMCLWDVRFRLPVNTWHHPAGAPVNAMALATAPLTRLGLRPGGSMGPLLYVAAGEGEVALWDVAAGRCHQVLRVLRPGALEASRRAVPSALATPSAPQLPFGPRPLDLMGRAKQLGLSELQAPQPRKDGCRALLPTPSGPLLTAGTDRAIRCWDSSAPTRSYVVCAAPPPLPPPHPAQLPAAAGGVAGGDSTSTSPASSHTSLVDVPRYEYSQRLVGQVPVVEELCTLERSSSSSSSSGQHAQRLGWAERAATQCHQAPILHMARIEATSQPLLLSCSHDGIIKAWA